jgi:SnoaL-like protein
VEDTDMHRPWLFVAVLVLAASSVGVAGLSASLDPAPASRTSSSSGVFTVRRYYEAANELIATGDPAALKEIFHPAMIDHSPPPAGPGGYGGIEGYLTYLHAIDPNIRLEPGAVVDDGQQIVAEVTVVATSLFLPLGLALGDPTTIWPSVEIFRVTEQRIVERRSPARWMSMLNRVHVFTLSEDLPEGFGLEAAALHFSGNARERFMSGAFPAVVHVLSGQLVLSLAAESSDPAIVVDAAHDIETEAPLDILPGKSARAAPGALLIVPPYSDYSLLNLSHDPAIAVTVSESIMSGDLLDEISYQRTSDSLEGIPDDRSSGFEVTASVLQIVPLKDTGADPAISIGTVTVSPGSSLKVASTTRLMMLWGEGSDPLVTDGNSACSVPTALVGNSESDEAMPIAVHVLCPHASDGGYLINPTGEPITVWIVAIGSMADPTTT